MIFVQSNSSVTLPARNTRIRQSLDALEAGSTCRIAVNEWPEHHPGRTSIPAYGVRIDGCCAQDWTSSFTPAG